MDIANVFVALGGDRGHTVPKTVTPSEVAVLQVLHGNEAVFDIEPVGEVERSSRDERARLHELYGRTQNGKQAIEGLFPGAAARLFETFDELGMDEEFFKAETRVKPAPKSDAKSAKKGKKAEVTQDEPEADGVDDMPETLFE